MCRRHRLSEADAADVVQSVWLRLLEHLEDVREPAALPGWLATTTARECVHLLRRDSTRQERERSAGEQRDITTELPSLDETVLAVERNDAIRAAFARLPDRCRRLLALLAHDPVPSYAEIGERLGMPVGALGPTRARCLAKLRALEPLSAFIGPDTERGRGRR